ncbi:rhodanese-related sulfurtransferase [Candidatus Saccharibacteria bacterium]|nr:rhodanese-related sulfurtransferase [Candidatus Saccharibacteria bacterium]
MQKIILYYKFAPLADPVAVRLWQRALCERLNLKGRILISKDGINGTIGGDIADLKQYVKEFEYYDAFKATGFKWSDGGREDFPKLVIRVRTEIVTFGAPDELTVDANGVVGGGIHLKPEAVHKLVAERGDEVLFFDSRNAYESTVGKFKNAIIPDVSNTRSFATELDDPKYDAIKDKPIVTYCTGGIRCEVLSVLMKNRGFKEVYQLDGGIVKYGETYGDAGLWEGSLYVFDNRMGTKFSKQAVDIAACIHCDTATSNYENCADKACDKLIVVCDSCAKDVLCADCSIVAVS